MKIKTIPFAIILVFLYSLQISASAQQQKILLPIDDLVVSAEKNAGGIKLLEVLDLTGDSILGYTHTKENDNNRIAIYVPVSRSEWVSSALHSGNLDENFKSGYSYLLLLKDLSIGGDEQEAYVKVKGTLYESQIGVDAYVFYKDIDNVMAGSSSGFRNVGNNLAELVKKEVLSSGAIRKTLDLTTKTKAELSKEYNEQMSFVNKQVFPTGVYMNFGEFKSLKPSFPQFTVNIDTLDKNVSVSGFSQRDSSLRSVDNAFAIATANELYILVNKKLYPVEARGNTLVLSKYIDEDSRKNNAAFWRMNIGGLINNEYRNPFDNVYTIQLDEYKGVKVKGEAVKINLENGSLEL